MQYTLKEIEKLADEYLKTLDGVGDDEYWITERNVYSIGIHDFIEWLQKREKESNKT